MLLFAISSPPLNSYLFLGGVICLCLGGFIWNKIGVPDYLREKNVVPEAIPNLTFELTQEEFNNHARHLKMTTVCQTIGYVCFLAGAVCVIISVL
jgi:hypothetical protein